MKRLLLLACLSALPAPLSAQTTAAATTQNEGAFHAELRREFERLRDKCSQFDVKQLGSCAVALATDHPLHVTFGTLAPQNGLGFGPALVMHHTPNENWRLNWSTDIVGAFSGAWRAGAYMKVVRTTVDVPSLSGGGSSGSPTRSTHPYPVIDVYAQTISLPKLTYFGIGPDTSRDAKAFFGMRQTIVGASAIYPVTLEGPFERLNLALLVEINNRLVDIRAANESGAPSIEERYSEATAPGLTNQPGSVQLGEGVRIMPSLADGRVQLNYLTKFQQFVALDPGYSFRRWTLDLQHEIPITKDRTPRSLPSDMNNPNDCSSGVTTTECAAVSRNRTGAVNLRFLLSRSGVSDTNVVPFYFQPTLGGSDINGNRMLASYEDYRFRGPHVLLLQESVEHSIGDWPVGIWLAADQGRVSLQDDNGDAGTFRKTFAAGLTLRAGGFPVMLLSWATGGSEGHHVAITISTSVLGGSSRPSLY